MVADDSASDRLIIRNMLSDFRILTASDGREAIQILEENEDINLLILDLNMPNMDGFQVLQKLRTDQKFIRIRTIILTNYEELENEIAGLKLGAVDYIRKPIHMESLRARIDIHIALIRTQNLLEQKLYQQGVTFELIFNQAPVGIAISYSYERDSADLNPFFSINPAFEKITGRTKEELLKVGWAAITHPDDLEENLKLHKSLLIGETNDYTMDKRYIKPDGSIVWVHMLAARLDLPEGHQFNHIAIMKDITESKETERKLVESERSKSVLLAHLPGMAYRCIRDRKRTMQYVSEGCLGLTGYLPENLINNKNISFVDLIKPEYRDVLEMEWNRVLRDQLPFSYEYEIETASGKTKWVLELGQGILNGQGEIEALEGMMIDISDRKAIETTLKYNNDHDRWTGLYNRSFLEDLLSAQTKQIVGTKRALISVNLSSLQTLTASYGFHYTQDLVKNIAHALMIHCAANRLLFNTYENRFVFYITEYLDKKELVEFSRLITQTLESYLSIERIAGGIGVIEMDQNNTLSADQILRNLLIASEKALEINDGEIVTCFYDSELEKEINREQEIKHELNQIIQDENDGGLYLQFQPILDLRSNQICSFEALARINGRSLGRVPPLEFIPIAEKTKLMIPVGTKIIRQAFRFLNHLYALGFDTISVSINISVVQLLKNDFCQNFLNIVREMQVIPENVIVEITESIFSSNYQEINRILAELQKAGIRISVDDFGTGYSSLSRERELNVNCLKIDKYFIDSLLSINPEKTITGDIISMAHRLDHCTVAEGVEHEMQWQYLLEHHCDMIQGYLISKPLDEDAAVELLKKSTAEHNFFRTFSS